MTKEEEKKFIKRYDKFKKNNLPTPFWDKERETHEWVWFSNRHKHLEVYGDMLYALGDIALTELYYPYTDKHNTSKMINGKWVNKFVINHNHAHSFDEVIKSLYQSPESFSISKDEEEFYSKRELEYLRRVQKYLLFIGLKDIDTLRIPVSRYRNKLQAKYENELIVDLPKESIKQILDGKRNFIVRKSYYNIDDERPKFNKYKALILDEEDNFIMEVEFIKEKLAFYKDIKSFFFNKEFNDDTLLILQYFNIIEVFDNKR